LAHVLAGAALGGKQRNLDAGMTEQEPQQFRTGVAGRAEYADFGSFLNRFGHGSFLLAVECDDRMRMMRRMISGGCRGTSSGGTRDDYARWRARAAAQATPRSLRELGRSSRRRRKKIRRAIIIMAGAL